MKTFRVLSLLMFCSRSFQVNNEISKDLCLFELMGKNARIPGQATEHKVRGMGNFHLIRTSIMPSFHWQLPAKPSNLDRDWFKKTWTVKKIWSITKNLQFLSYHFETWSKRRAIEVVLLTKFHDDSSKIVDFLKIFCF